MYFHIRWSLLAQPEPDNAFWTAGTNSLFFSKLYRMAKLPSDASGEYYNCQRCDLHCRLLTEVTGNFQGERQQRFPRSLHVDHALFFLLQESIMDFYWHYSSKELIDPAGKANFFKAIGVASQVFNTLSEVIQGPCPQNQQALAHSRLSSLA